MTSRPSTDVRFRTIYDAHYGAVRNYCLRRLPPADVGDVMAEVFTIVWRKMADAPTSDEVLPWIYGVARHVLANQRRGTRRGLRLVAKIGAQPVETDPGPEPVVVRREADRVMLAALDQLRPEEQELLRLRAWEQLSSARIGEVLGISADAVDMRLARARRKLERLVNDGSINPLFEAGGEQ